MQTKSKQVSPRYKDTGIQQIYVWMVQLHLEIVLIEQMASLLCTVTMYYMYSLLLLLLYPCTIAYLEGTENNEPVILTFMIDLPIATLVKRY